MQKEPEWKSGEEKKFIRKNGFPLGKKGKKKKRESLVVPDQQLGTRLSKNLEERGKEMEDMRHKTTTIHSVAGSRADQNGEK